MLRLKFNKSFFINLLFVLLISALSLFVYQNRQNIVDQLTIWQYPTSGEIVELVNRSGMNNEGKFIYAASRPSIESTQIFNNVCSSIENTMSILGCYTNNRIYVYDVTDKELDGIREVTATHEALHAVYARLSTEEKQYLEKLLDAEYKKLESDEEYKDRMEFYARTEPGEKYNELHSVIGTEISNISDDLETYYARFFSDRQKVVSLYKKYSAVFQKLNDRAEELSQQLNDLTNSINDRVAKYNIAVALLNTDIDEFNKMANDGSFESQTQFYQARQRLVTRSESIESERLSINDDISTYNKILKEYNSNAAKSEKLYNSIDSTLAPSPSI